MGKWFKLSSLANLSCITACGAACITFFLFAAYAYHMQQRILFAVAMLLGMFMYFLMSMLHKKRKGEL